MITQGKWKAVKWDTQELGYSIRNDTKIDPIAQINAEEWHQTKEEAEANAQLIANAPETKQQRDGLLETCNETRTLLDTAYALKLVKAPNNFHIQIDLILKKLNKAIKNAESEV